MVIVNNPVYFFSLLDSKSAIAHCISCLHLAALPVPSFTMQREKVCYCYITAILLVKYTLYSYMSVMDR